MLSLACQQPCSPKALWFPATLYISFICSKPVEIC
uniref:Uncharacterized protein n=1 Tax=Anguilla anguilla TaxID=7936 RepID=A0A0E9R0P3_ANGAN